MQDDERKDEYENEKNVKTNEVRESWEREGMKITNCHIDDDKRFVML